MMMTNDFRLKAALEMKEAEKTKKTRRVHTSQKEKTDLRLSNGVPKDVFKALKKKRKAANKTKKMNRGR